MMNKSPKEKQSEILRKSIDRNITIDKFCDIIEPRYSTMRIDDTGWSYILCDEEREAIRNRAKKILEWIENSS